jgi:hypothetical protein
LEWEKGWGLFEDGKKWNDFEVVFDELNEGCNGLEAGAYLKDVD